MGTLTSRNTLGHSRPVMGLLYLLLIDIVREEIRGKIIYAECVILTILLLCVQFF
jgi:hypothetical protein